MIRLGEKIRLTPAERLRWVKLTGFILEDVRTLRELNAFIEGCRRYFDGHGPETKLMHALIERERERCFDGPDEFDKSRLKR